MSVWNKLQKSLYTIVTENVHFQIHCAVYRMKSARGGTDLPRYWITIDKEIVFDYPKQFLDREETKKYPYETEIGDISNCIREYINCPVQLLLDKKFENDVWGITEIFKAVDKRLGKEKLQAYFVSPTPTIKGILDKRFR